MSERPRLGATRTDRGAARPVIKEPVWTIEIPLYFYAGGLAGASAGLGWLSERHGDAGMARRAWATALVGSMASPALLISDLGVPTRFLHMLRMFKVTSPMSVGSWILAGFGASTGLGAIHALSGGRLGAAGRGAQTAAALLGLPLASYTGALVANTAVPVWHQARTTLPFVFVCGAALSAGAVAVIVAPVEEAQAARRLVIGAAVAELALTHLMERRLSAAGIGEAYRGAASGRSERAAKWLTAAGAVLVGVAGKRSRSLAVAGGALASAGAIAERFAVFRAGFRSAARPQDTIGPQRARIARRRRAVR